MTRIVFWQYLVSMTDLPYIVELINNPIIYEVVIIAKQLSKVRKDMGWDTDIPGLERCKLYVEPNNEIVENIISKDTENSVHLFSSINVYPHVFDAFKISLKYNVKRGIICERPMTYWHGIDWAKPLWLHRMKFIIENGKYIKYINYVFGMGQECCDYYRSISKKWIIFPFAYCTRGNALPNVSSGDVCKVAFVGGLSIRKDVITLLKAAKRLKSKGLEKDFSFFIIGDGSQKEKLQNFVKENDLQNIHFLGMRQNREVPSLLAQQDIFVLPSIHDGWGAVVNEALQAGLYTIASDRCGSKELLYDKRRGVIFPLKDDKKLSQQLENCFQNLQEIRSNVNYRKTWAEQAICGKVIANYMVDCLIGKQVERPWFCQ